MNKTKKIAETELPEIESKINKKIETKFSLNTKELPNIEAEQKIEIVSNIKSFNDFD